MDQIKIGKFILENRKKKKLTQEQLADNIGVNSRSVSRWENGQCMPDLSLYDSICKELDITINELLSGEHINRDEYQAKFEKNVIDVVDKVERKNRYSNILTNALLGIIVIFILGFICFAFYSTYQFKQDYQEDKMLVVKEDNLMFRTFETGTTKYIFKNITINDEKVGIVFITHYRTLEDMNNDSKIYDNNYIDLTNKYPNGTGILIENTKLNKKIKIYYTTTSFKKIGKANAEEIKKIINKSYLMYEN